MNKLLALLFLSFTIACSAWAEKYDYVRLFIDPNSSDQTTVSVKVDYYTELNFTLYESLELGEGEAAKIVSLPNSYSIMSAVGYLVLVNELGTFAYDTSGHEGAYFSTQTIVGPGKIYAAWRHGSEFIGSPDTPNESCITLSIDKADYNKHEYAKLIFDPNENLTLYHEQVVTGSSSGYPEGSSWRKYLSGTGITLNSGDYAQVIGFSTPFGPDLVLDTGDKKIPYPVQTWSNSRTDLPNSENIIVGEGQLYAGAEADPGDDIQEADIRCVDLRIVRASQTGSKTLAWNGSDWASTGDSQQANNSEGSVEYDNLLGWAYFTDSNWVYSYSKLSWYYLHGTADGLYAWNANLPDSGWFKLR
jgi:hypothetical protein